MGRICAGLLSKNIRSYQLTDVCKLERSNVVDNFRADDYVAGYKVTGLTKETEEKMQAAIDEREVKPVNMGFRVPSNEDIRDNPILAERVLHPFPGVGFRIARGITI